MARRLPVEGFREYVETTRFLMVDDGAENVASTAVQITQRTQTDNMDTLVFMIMIFEMFLMVISTYQADVNFACRRLSMRQEYLCVFSDCRHVQEWFREERLQIL